MSSKIKTYLFPFFLGLVVTLLISASMLTFLKLIAVYYVPYTFIWWYNNGFSYVEGQQEYVDASVMVGYSPINGEISINTVVSNRVVQSNSIESN